MNHFLIAFPIKIGVPLFFGLLAATHFFREYARHFNDMVNLILFMGIWASVTLFFTELND